MNPLSDNQLKDNLEKTLKQNNYSRNLGLHMALLCGHMFEPEVTLSSTLKVGRENLAYGHWPQEA